MNRFRKVFACLLTGFVLIALVLLFSGETIAGLLVILVARLILLYAQLNPSSQLLGPVVTRFQTSEQEVWLTIDDGPDAEETPVVLDLLDRYQAKATFFLIGDRVAANPELVRLILKRGHHIGNHTMHHFEGRFWRMFRRDIEAEINDCSRVITEITGVTPEQFRAPVGHKPWSLHAVLRKAGFPLIGWTVRGLDGVSMNCDRIVSRILKKISPGAIILLHEGRGTLPDTLSEILSDLSDKNYRCVLPSPSSFSCGRRKVIR